MTVPYAGATAKPIIDPDVVIADRVDPPTVIERLGPLGYRHEGDFGVPGREAFTTPAGAPAHHLYVGAVGTPALGRISPSATLSVPTRVWSTPTAT